jgi:sulfur-oxidizing protein SoxY
MINRRKFLSVLSAGSSVAVAVLAFPGSVLAWAENAFKATTLADAESALFPGNRAQPSGQVKLKAPQIAENGAVVPITVSTDLPDVSNISLLVEKNPSPLCASFNIDPSLEPEISVRIRMGETSNVVAIVKSGAKTYQASQEVKVTIGGCGG